MNPFTESTVALPLTEPRRPAANEVASRESKASSQNAEPRTPSQSPNAGRGRRLVRDPRSLRLARHRARGRGYGQRDNEEHKAGGKPQHPAANQRPVATKWALHCRRAVGAAMGLALSLGVSAAWAVNVNSASAQQLETITGIGPKTAQVIIEERTRGGSFESFDDLAERVKGIGPKKAQSLQAAGLTVGQGGAAPPAPVPAVQRKAGK